MRAIIKNQQYKAIDAIAQKKGSFAQASFLQLEALVPQGGGNVRFGLTKADSVARASERRLDQNDAFVATEIGLYIKQESAVAPGAKMLETYPNQTAFAAEATFVVLADLVSIFNSRLSIKVGDKMFAEAINMVQSLEIPTSQQSAAGNFSERNQVSGLFDLQPIITFQGTGKNEIILSIPANGQKIQNSTAGVTTGIYAVLRMEGFLITGGDKIGQIDAKY